MDKTIKVVSVELSGLQVEKLNHRLSQRILPSLYSLPPFAKGSFNQLAMAASYQGFQVIEF